jgi:hypothetical protein
VLWSIELARTIGLNNEQETYWGQQEVAGPTGVACVIGSTLFPVVLVLWLGLVLSTVLPALG